MRAKNFLTNMNVSSNLKNWWNRNQVSWWISLENDKRQTEKYTKITKKYGKNGNYEKNIRGKNFKAVTQQINNMKCLNQRLDKTHLNSTFYLQKCLSKNGRHLNVEVIDTKSDFENIFYSFSSYYSVKLIYVHLSKSTNFSRIMKT